MHLTYRPATAQDVEACLEMLPPGFVCGASCRARLADAWRNWLREGIMQMTVLEDGMRPSVSRRIAFGNSVFVTEAFAQETKASLPPPLGVQVVRRWGEGRSPVLDLRALRAANSGPGLTLLILHIGWMPRLTAEEVRWAKGKLLEALLFFFSGYQLKEVLQEVYSEEERQRGMAAGAHLKNDYAAFYRAHPEALPTPECRPYLLGGSRAETADGSYLSPLFFYHPPRFFFKIGEQEVLRLALLDRQRGGVGQPERVALHGAKALADDLRARQRRRAGLLPFRGHVCLEHARGGQAPAPARLSTFPSRRAEAGQSAEAEFTEVPRIKIGRRKGPDSAIWTPSGDFKCSAD